MKNSLSSEIWSRSGHSTISKNLYLLMLMFWTLFGLAVTGFIATQTMELILHWWHALAVLAITIAGIFVAKSDNPIISLLGYMMVAVPFGFTLGPVLSQHSEASILNILGVTGIVTVVLGTLGAIIPHSLQHWAGWLFGALIVLIVGYFAIPILGAFGLPVEDALTIWDWIGIFIFCALIVFDMNRALRIPYTHDNAIDSALALYLDILNLFLLLLRRD